MHGQNQNKASIRKLPDWSLAQKPTGSLWGTCIPPVFTAMIDTLPRDADVEWHAITGIGTGLTGIVVSIFLLSQITLLSPQNL
jgi:hypothetical protein